MGFFSFSKTVLNNLFNKPATVLYPVTPKEYTKVARGHISIEIDQCIFCGICNKKCPTSAISVEKADKQWEINRLSCIQCNSCVESCPKKCLTMEGSFTPPSASAVIDKYHA